MSRESRPHISELTERCDSCCEELGQGSCCTIGCIEYERATHGEPQYAVQFSGWSVPCATLRRAIDLRGGQGWSRVVRFGHAPVDCDDDGLTDLEKSVLEMTDCDGRDALIALIDGKAAEGRAA
jgi:hypothetical protein